MRGEPVSHTSRPTASEPPRSARRPARGASESASSGCRIRTRDVLPFGLVLEAVLSGRQDPEFWEEVHRVLREEVARRSPDYLVFDLRELDCAVGSAFVGGLTAGAVEMKNIGRLNRTRIVATGEIARRLATILPLCKLEPVLGLVHPDLKSALAADPG